MDINTIDTLLKDKIEAFLSIAIEQPFVSQILIYKHLFFYETWIIVNADSIYRIRLDSKIKSYANEYGVSEFIDYFVVADDNLTYGIDYLNPDYNIQEAADVCL